MFQIDCKSMRSLYTYDENLYIIMVGMPLVLNYSFNESHAFEWLLLSSRLSHLLKRKDCYTGYKGPNHLSVSSGGKARVSDLRTAA